MLRTFLFLDTEEDFVPDDIKDEDANLTAEDLNDSNEVRDFQSYRQRVIMMTKVHIFFFGGGGIH